MKKKLGLSLPVVAALMFTACGDETTSELLKAESFASKNDLPECGEKYDGHFAVIPSKGEVYVCAANEKDGEKAWEWSSVGGSATVSGKFDCKAEELKDKSGYKLMCNGDSLAVVKNGTKGDSGEAGKTLKAEEVCSVETTDTGVKLTCGGQSVEVKNGESATTPEKLKDDNACDVIYAGVDVFVYNCGENKFSVDANRVKVPTWKGLSQKSAICAPVATRSVRSERGVRSLDDASICDETIAVWGKDADKGSIQWKSASMDKTLDEYYGLVGTATLTLEKDTAFPAVVGARFEMGNDYSIAGSWGGLCLTYSSENDTKVYIGSNNMPELFATLPATKGKESTVDIPWNKFASYYGESSTKDLLKKLFVCPTGEFCLDIGATYARVSFVEGSKANTKYENNFGLFEFGAYGKCSGNTVTKIKDNLAATKSEGSFTVGNKKYNTVTIDGQTWLAENLSEKPMVAVAAPVIAGSSQSGSGYSSSSTGSSASSEVSVEQRYVCLDGDACKSIGYKWDVADDICPEGYGLPSLEDFNHLLYAVSMDYYSELGVKSGDIYSFIATYGGDYTKFAYKVLASEEDWPEGEAGWDLVGFNLKPTQKQVDNGEEHGYSGLWTNTPGNYTNYAFAEATAMGVFGRDDRPEGSEFAVRCIKKEKLLVEAPLEEGLE